MAHAAMHLRTPHRALPIAVQALYQSAYTDREPFDVHEVGVSQGEQSRWLYCGKRAGREDMIVPERVLKRVAP
jgi:hypothetical protein